MATAKRPTKKQAAPKIAARTLQARVSDQGLLATIDRLMKETGWTEADFVRTALREYADRDRLRDDIAAMDERFGATINRLMDLFRVTRDEVAVIVAFMHEFSGMYLFNTPEPPEDVRAAAAADAQRRHEILMRRVAAAFSGGNSLGSIALSELEKDA